MRNLNDAAVLYEAILNNEFWKMIEFDLMISLQFTAEQEWFL